MSLPIENNIAKVLESIRSGEKKYHRQAHCVNLMAVSKTHPAEAIRQAATAGIRHIGENYISEALKKIHQLQDLDLCWHFIGPIQSSIDHPQRPFYSPWYWFLSAHRYTRLPYGRWELFQMFYPSISYAKQTYVPPLSNEKYLV